MEYAVAADYKTIKIARTISNLAGSEQIQSEHIAEAIQYKRLDKQCWGYHSFLRKTELFCFF